MFHFKNSSLSLGIAALLSLTLFGYVPFVSYYANRPEFFIGSHQLIVTLMPAFLLFFVCAVIVLMVGKKIFPVRSISIWGGSVTVGPVDIVSLALVFLIWLEGSILAIGLPSITGDAGLFDSFPRAMVDTIVWGGVVCLAVVRWRALAPRGGGVFLCLTLLLVVGFIEAKATSPGKCANFDMRHVVASNLAFHPEKNVIVLVSDTFASDVALAIFKESPELASSFDGFTLYENNLSTGSGTKWAIPAALLGEVYPGGGHGVFNKKSIEDPESLLQKFIAKGFYSYFSTINFLPSGYISTDSGSTVLTKKDTAVVSQDVVAALAIRFAPYVLKSSLESVIMRRGVIKSKGNEELPRTGTMIEEFIIPSLVQVSNTPTFHFHHFWGVHPPYTLDSNGLAQSAEEQNTFNGFYQRSIWEIGLFVKFINALKQRGMYEGATIIFMGDHGDHFLNNGENRSRGVLTTHDYPLLMVKPPYATGPLLVSDAPTSIPHVRDIALKCEEDPEGLAAFLGSLSEERLQYVHDGFEKIPPYYRKVIGTAPDSLILEVLPVGEAE